MNPVLDAITAAELLAASRHRTLHLVEHVSTDDLERVLSEPMSPLVWDLAHIAAYEDLWLCHHHGGLPLLREDLAAMYDAFETPRAVRGDLPLLVDAQARQYLEEVRARSLDVLEQKGPGDGGLVELVAFHEFQHTETMRQAMALAGMLPDGEPPESGTWQMASEHTWIDVEGGTFTQGATAEGFAYDNERPAHEVTLPPFRIATQPVSNAEWRGFVEAGGYEDETLWSEEGLVWKAEFTVSDHAASHDAPPPAPVQRICFHEAEAFSRYSDCRLPSESEWEWAASAGLLEVVGEVWEWTSSTFEPYPGFEVYPYPEYSKVFFDGSYKVLRGGSWASDPLIESTTFRNWDLPQRRQLFAGLRLADDHPGSPA